MVGIVGIVFFFAGRYILINILRMLRVLLVYLLHVCIAHIYFYIYSPNMVRAINNSKILIMV